MAKVRVEELKAQGKKVIAIEKEKIRAGNENQASISKRWEYKDCFQPQESAGNKKLQGFLNRLFR